MIHMLQTYRTMASFNAKIDYFSLESTFNIDRKRPDKRTSVYIFFMQFEKDTFSENYTIKLNC
jgi:hypothetical protein